MNLINTLIPSFVPEIKGARKVSFKSKEDLRDEETAKVEADSKREAYRQLVIYRMKLHRWKKKWEAQAKKVKEQRAKIKSALKLLEAIEREKPLPPVVGNPSSRLLESVDVVTKEEIPSFAQSPV